MSARRIQLVKLRRRIHQTLDGGGFDTASRLFHAGLVVLVCASVMSVVLETVPALAQSYGIWFVTIEALSVAAFTVEYLLRLWGAPDHTPYRDLSAGAARMRFALTPSALVDLCSVLPFYLAFFIPQDLRVLVLLRLLRFFKLARYSPGMRSLIAALEAERKALFASAVVLLGLVLIAAAAMHLVEHEAQPDKFGSIPDAMWWAVVTLTTVGYGDVVPVTLAGRIVAGFTMLGGLMMLALPIGIVANAFTEEIHRREFVVTWSMLARVPLFSSLSASEIAEVMNYLRAQTVPADTVVMRRGEVASCMYFITSGTVEIETRKGPVRLGEGHFFGEMALMRRSNRTATVRTLEPTKLLVLEAGDLNALMERNAEISARIEAIVRERE
jgi:voltage-gated potassium channel